MENIEKRLARIEAHLFGKTEQPQVQPDKLRDFVVPLAHDTLTREEVGERCVAAAKLKGYNGDLSNPWGSVNGLAYGSQPMTHFLCHSDIPFGFRHHDCQNLGKNSLTTLTTLEAFEEYCGVQPLPPLPDEPKKYVGFMDETQNPEMHGIVNTLDSNKKVYEAGFWWNNVTNLNLPDGSNLHFGVVSNVWQKSVRAVPRSARSHALKPVKTHTVGMFYAIRGAAGEHLNDYRNYALCVGEGQFVNATDDCGVIVVERARERDVTLNEVTPA